MPGERQLKVVQWLLKKEIFSQKRDVRTLRLQAVDRFLVAPPHTARLKQRMHIVAPSLAYDLEQAQAVATVVILAGNIGGIDAQLDRFMNELQPLGVGVGKIEGLERFDDIHPHTMPWLACRACWGAANQPIGQHLRRQVWSLSDV